MGKSNRETIVGTTQQIQRLAQNKSKKKSKSLRIFQRKLQKIAENRVLPAALQKDQKVAVLENRNVGI